MKKSLIWMVQVDLAFYWHGLRKNARRFSTRQNGGGFVMVYGAISVYDVSNLIFID